MFGIDIENYGNVYSRHIVILYMKTLILDLISYRS
jgi:hypothetical protein